MKLYPLASLLFLICIFCPALTNAQATETYQGKGFSLRYLKDWKTRNENGVFNFYPEDNSGAVTVSSYANIQLTVVQLKPGLLEAICNNVNDLDSIKVTSINDITILSYECVSNEIKWVARIYKKKNNLYFITVNSTADAWSERKALYIQVIESFKLD